jgi:3-methyladenine DNA glycosylase AlkD
MSKYLNEFHQKLRAMGNPARVPALAKFFQAYPGGYGEGDLFYSISVPEQRKLSKAYFQLLTLDELEILLTNSYHEVRLTTLMMLVLRFQKSKDVKEQEAIVKIYLNSMDYINNWDLVDSSAHHILGHWLLDKPHDILHKLAGENHLWKQRISMISTAYFITKGQFDTTFKLAEKLLHHKHDLIHKAVGWMLREIGNRNYQAEYDFLLKHYTTMPRTMLRYAIEKFEEPVRQGFLKGTL